MRNKNDFQVVNGMSYHKETPSTIVQWLETSRQRKQRIRIFYGDVVTGCDWMEEYDTIGYVGRSTGEIKIPLLIKSSRSNGGTAILDHCIVKITVDKTIVYQHPNYHTGEIKVKEADSTLKEQGYNTMVYINDVNHANFKTMEKAAHWIDFIQGKRNAK